MRTQMAMPNLSPMVENPTEARARDQAILSCCFACCVAAEPETKTKPSVSWRAVSCVVISARGSEGRRFDTRLHQLSD